MHRPPPEPGPAPDASPASAPSPGPAPDAALRPGIERALVEASRLLVSSSDVDLREVLRLLAEAVGSDSAYLLTVSDAASADAAASDGGPAAAEADAAPLVLESVTRWHREGCEPAGDESPFGLPSGLPFAAELDGLGCHFRREDDDRVDGVAIPILSEEDRFIGYLGIEHLDLPMPTLREHGRVLSVFGDLLASYLSRTEAERALRESEERYRTFVQTISEAVWRVDLREPVPTALPPAQQVHALLGRAYLAECNAMMLDLLGAPDAEAVLGLAPAALLPGSAQVVARAFVESGYRLHSLEVAVPQAEGRPRHFSINATGRVEGGALVRVWGSTNEVTLRAELERRMVRVLEEQQERVGQDLHDSVGQLLTGIRMLSDNLAARHAREGDGEDATARRIAEFADQATEQVRQICRTLVPPLLYQEGLALSLDALAATADALPDVRCSFEHDGEADVADREACLQLYRIAQEAVNNALKHARPHHIRLRLGRQNGHIALQVIDDGCGFDPEAIVRPSVGLYSMQRRAGSVRARLDVTSAVGDGTVVTVELPAR